MAFESNDRRGAFGAPVEPPDPEALMADAPSLGEGLRATREASGRSLMQMTTVTRVHVRYLKAIEEGDFSALPSRVFAIGYVRAYAGALGLDEQSAVERFKRESPDGTVPLQAPIGIAFEDVRRYSPRVVAGIAVVLIAVVGWNVFQRVRMMHAPPPSEIAEIPETWAQGAARDGRVPLTVGAPHPAPADQTIPALYVTPGLEAQLTGVDPADPEAVAAAAAAAARAVPVQAAFNPRGAIYGAPPSASQVVIQAKKPSALVVRAGDNRVLFARQLATGEAWRAPPGITATIDASDPKAFDVYLNGERGPELTTEQTPLATLYRQAEALTQQAAAESAAQAMAAQRAAEQAAAARAAATPASPAGRR